MYMTGCLVVLWEGVEMQVRVVTFQNACKWRIQRKAGY
jgi:hypothetical protein